MSNASWALSPQPPANGPSMRFENRVMDGIASEVFTAFNAVPRRGAEAGGILLGHLSGGQVVVEDFEPVLCEHRYGPSYWLDEEDLRGLEESLEWFRGARHGGLEVLGFYRSQTRSDLSADAHDQELMQRFFGAGSIFLLLKPDRLQTITAEVFRFDEGALLPAAGPMPFPLDAPVGIPVHSVERALVEPEPEVQAPLLEEPLPPEVMVEERPAEQRRLLVAPTELEQSNPEPSSALPDAGQETRPAEPQRILPPAVHPRRLETQELPDRSRWWWVAAVAALTIAGAILGYHSVGMKAPGPPPAQSGAPAVPAVAPGPSPTPVASLSTPSIGEPAQASLRVEQEIRAALGHWTRALRSGNPTLIAECYAPQMERYFQERNASSATVRRAVAQSLARYGRPAVLRISDLRIIPLSPDRALATFRKHWQTAGPRIVAGEEQERLTFARVRDSWRIASELETRVYWTQRRR